MMAIIWRQLRASQHAITLGSSARPTPQPRAARDALVGDVVQREQAQPDGPALRPIDSIGDTPKVERRVARPPDERHRLGAIEA